MNNNIELRDWFAGMALQGICVNTGRNRFNFDRPKDLADKSYEIADAMMNARKKPNAETIEAMQELEDGKGSKYKSVDEFMEVGDD